MRAHIVVSPVATRFAASEAEARQHRTLIVDNTPGLKKSQVTIEPIDIPTGKVDLLAFLNEREAKHDKAE